MAHECVHAGGIRDVTPSALGCEECLKIGSPWVHLRLCRTCGHVGCCDSSPNRHATKHFHNTRHPIIEGTIRRKAGDGAMSTRLFWTLADASRRTTGGSRATFELAEQTTANESAR
jgi:ubiquitin-hydrolase Zn-finger-containing protein